MKPTRSTRSTPFYFTSLHYALCIFTQYLYTIRSSCSMYTCLSIGQLLPNTPSQCYQPPEGGGHCLFECRYPLPNYRPCFSTLSVPQSFFTATYFLRDTYHHSLKSNGLNTKLFTNVIQSLLKSFLNKEECHVSDEIEEIQT